MKKRFIYMAMIGTLMLSTCSCQIVDEENVVNDNYNELSFLEDNDCVVAGAYYIAVKDEWGSVLFTYQMDREYYPELQVTSWKNVNRLMKNEEFPVAISTSGEFLAPEEWSLDELTKNLQETMSELPTDAVFGTSMSDYVEYATVMENWEELQLVVGDYPYSVLGLKKDGTLCEAGISEVVEDTEQVLQWEALKDVAILYRGEIIVALDRDGNILSEGIAIDDWNDIVSIESGKCMIYGLTKDGKVLHTPHPFAADYSTEAMQDIVFLAVGYDYEINQDVVYGIRKDGKVVNHLGEIVPGFEHMLEIDVTLADGILVGLNEYDKLVISEKADANFRKMVEEYNRY